MMKIKNPNARKKLHISFSRVLMSYEGAKVSANGIGEYQNFYNMLKGSMEVVWLITDLTYST